MHQLLKPISCRRRTPNEVANSTMGKEKTEEMMTRSDCMEAGFVDNPKPRSVKKIGTDKTSPTRIRQTGVRTTPSKNVFLFILPANQLFWWGSHPLESAA